jgi:hypothetical protein
MSDRRQRRFDGLSPWLLFGLLACWTSSDSAAHADDQARFQLLRQRAQAALEERMTARLDAGWTPKSPDQQMVTRLERLEDSRVRRQEKLMTRATAEAARAEVYITLARHYSRIGSYRRARVRTYAVDRVTGAYRPVSLSGHFWVMDPFAARLSAHFGEKSARSKAISAAHEFHANTYYERMIRNTGTRIAALQRKISLDAQLAGQVP